MNWRLLLSEYPEPLLEGPLPVALLVMIERAGMATEETLRNDLGIPQEKLVSTLLSLHNSKLIEYTREHILLSDRGRQMLDKFDVRDEIFGDLLKGIPLRVAQRETLLERLADYRANYFNKYLESVRATRHWVQICHHTTVVPELARSAALGRLAILFHDLEYISALPELKDAEAGEESPDIWGKALRWLKLKKDASLHRMPLMHLSKCSPLEVQLWSVHCQSRASLKTEMWDLEWSRDTGRWARAMEACADRQEISVQLASYWEDRLEFSPIEVARAKIASAASQLEVLQKKFEPLLLLLFSASTLDELAEASKIPESTLRPLLRQLRSKCDLLLEPERCDQAIEDGQVQS